MLLRTAACSTNDVSRSGVQVVGVVDDDERPDRQHPNAGGKLDFTLIPAGDLATASTRGRFRS